MMSATTALACACLFVGVLNFVVLYELMGRGSVPVLISRAKIYSYIGVHLPIYLIRPEELPEVALEVEESVHNGLGASAMLDWEDGVSATFGWYTLGPNHLLYTSTMSHERHCLRMLWHALNPEATQTKISNAHAQHCLNYLRQMTLCLQDLTLEPPDVLSRHWDIDRAGGAPHICRDWTLALRGGRETEAQWKIYKTKYWEGSDLD